MTLSSVARENVQVADAEGVSVSTVPSPSYATAAGASAQDSDSAPVDARLLARELAPYREPSPGRSAAELAITFLPFAALYGAMLVALSAGYWIGLLLAVPAGALLLRLFLIQHDCGHEAFFPSRRANDWVGRSIGVLTLTPYDCWRRSHALHHARHGNLDARGFGDVDTLTVKEFEEKSWAGRLLYRLYRHPVVLFGLGPAYLFLFRHRLPIGLMTAGSRYWYSAIGTNLALIALAIPLMLMAGVIPVIVTHVAIVLVAASGGVWLFYVQHQFEETQWDSHPTWSFHHSALHGSSYLHLPRWLQWVTANIGVHHVHHLVSRIPFYRLPEVLRDRPDLSEVNRITIRTSLSTLKLALWDEEQRRLVSFRDARRLALARA